MPGVSELRLRGAGGDAGELESERANQELGPRMAVTNQWALPAYIADIAAQAICSQNPAEKERLLGWANAALVYAWSMR
jgi:hypothetical protein